MNLSRNLFAMQAINATIYRDTVEESVDLFQVLNLFLAIVIVIINSGVIAMFVNCRRDLLTTPSHKLLFSLAICDFFTGITIASHIIVSINKVVNIVVRILIDMFTSLFTGTVILHLCGITLDRYLSLFFALRYRDLVTVTRSFKFIIFAWVLPTFASFIQFIWLYKLMDRKETRAEAEHIGKIEPWYSIIMLTLFFILPLVVLSIAFLKMFIEIRKLLLRTPSRRNGDVSTLATHRQKRIIIVFCIMYVCFVLFSLPYFTLRMIGDLQYWIIIRINLNEFYFDTAYTLKAFTSISNPIIYTAMNREFRAVIYKLFLNLRRKLGETRLRNFSAASSSFVNLSMRRRSHPSTSGNDSGIVDACVCETEVTASTEISVFINDESNL